MLTSGSDDFFQNNKLSLSMEDESAIEMWQRKKLKTDHIISSHYEIITKIEIT